MKKIFVIGSANTDMVVKAAKLPSGGETVIGGTFYMNAGGKGANQAVAAARLGGSVSMVAKLGKDIFGKQTLVGLNRENINIDFVFSDEEAPSGVALIMVNGSGENCIAVAPGANAKLLPADIAKVKNLWEAEIILTQLEIPIETIEAIVKIAKSKNRKVILNPAPAQVLNDELLNGLFLITPNETEASILTGIKVEDEKTASLASRALLNKGVQNVVITLGRQGVYFENSTLTLKIDAPLVKAVDTTAAGDTFSGAIAVGLAEERDNEEAGWERVLKFAVKAASISVTRLGAQSSIPYRNEIII